MLIDILAIGSRGDVQPFIALALGIKSAGYQVRMVTLDGFEELVERYDLDHLSIGQSPQSIAATATGQKWVSQRQSLVGFARRGAKVVSELLESGLSNYWDNCQDTQVVITSIGGLPVAVPITEKKGLTLIRAQTIPSIVSRYDWNGHTNRSIALRRRCESMGWSLFRSILWMGIRRATNKARSRVLELPPQSLRDPIGELVRRQVPMLDAYSTAVVKRPKDWGDWINVTGYWFLQSSTRPQVDAELVQFLQAGQPPVFVGFGSTPFPQPEMATKIIIDALTLSDKRGVVVAGGSGLTTGRLHDKVLSVSAVPHDWLFPKVAAAVHHGGAGVTGAALRAGLPSVVVPIFADQPFWARRVFELGAGPKPIPAEHLSTGMLAQAITCTSNQEMRRRAQSIGNQIRKEDGVGQAVNAINSIINSNNLQ